MAHGFGATKDAGLTPFAERFAAAGADVVVFDYRGFGTSDGTPRQTVDHRRHREDYRSVVAHVRAMDGVDPDRVVLWGTSYSGGHVVAVAAGDPRVAAVVSQGAAMDGLAAVLEIRRYAGPASCSGSPATRCAGAVQRGHTIPIVGPPGLAGRDHLARRAVGLRADHGPDVPQRDAGPRHPADHAQPPGRRRRRSCGCR